MMRLCGLAVNALALVGCAAGDGNAETEPNDTAIGSGWELVWQDEFEGTELDRSNWAPEESCWGGGNNERQCYTDRQGNISVQDGFLTLKARTEQYTGPDRPPEIALNPNPKVTQEYTSGKVRTKGLHSWKYGRIEVRAKVPAGQGMWPAVWMMPEDAVYGSWPLSGEIDILEAVNIGAPCLECDGDVGENRTVSALHFGKSPPNNLVVDKKTPLPDLSLPSGDFHIYSVEWGQGLIRFLVDGKVHLTVTADQWSTGSEKAKGNPNAPFDQRFYVMANLAVGGAWPERSNAKGLAQSSLPNEFAIDWIRVYQCKQDPETGLACMN